jgi:hypothetical protein
MCVQSRVPRSNRPPTPSTQLSITEPPIPQANVPNATTTTTTITTTTTGENVGSGSSESIPGRLGAWTEGKKERILSSRRDGTALLVKTIQGLKNPPKVRKVKLGRVCFVGGVVGSVGCWECFGWLVGWLVGRSVGRAPDHPVNHPPNGTDDI